MALITVAGGLAFLVIVTILGATERWEQLVPAAGSGLACWLGAVVALLPVWRASRRNAERVPLAALAGMGARLLISAAGVAGLLGLAGLPVAATPLWALGWYLLLLAVEVGILVNYFRQWPRPETP